MINQHETLVLEYMSTQPEINYKMRSTLILWLVQVAQEFQLEQTTLHLALHLLDRVGTCVHIKTQEYQLVGLCCLWIASKVEQNHGQVPCLKRLGHMCCHTYSIQQFKHMEQWILYLLGFRVHSVSPLHFLELLWELEECELGHVGVSLCHYVLEMAVLHKRFVGVLPYTMARASMVVAHRLLDARYSVVSFEVEMVADQLVHCLHHIPQTLVKKVYWID
jgi:hypothetical protein